MQGNIFVEFSYPWYQLPVQNVDIYHSCKQKMWQLWHVHHCWLHVNFHFTFSHPYIPSYFILLLITSALHTVCRSFTDIKWNILSYSVVCSVLLQSAIWLARAIYENVSLSINLFAITSPSLYGKATECLSESLASYCDDRVFEAGIFAEFYWLFSKHIKNCVYLLYLLVRDRRC